MKINLDPKDFLKHYNYSVAHAVQTMWNLVDSCDKIFMFNYQSNQVSICWLTNTLSYSQDGFPVNYSLQIYADRQVN